MKKRLRNFIRGMATVQVLYPNTKSKVQASLLADTDAEALTQDWQNVGNDIRRAMEQWRDRRKRNPRFNLSANTPQQNRPIAAVKQPFSGHLPPPAILAGYEQVLHGAADRTITIAESEAGHRHKMAEMALNEDYNEARLGQTLVLIMAVSAILCGTFIALAGYQIAGSVMGGGGVIAVFMMGRAKN